MDKSQAIHLESCALQSWWEFSVDCAVHVYNHTPIMCHNWKTPFENLERMKPDVTHLCVFGCSAYVFLLEEVCHNKLNPKSELMTFTGYPQAVKGYLFMRSPNNVLFTAVQALFDETLYPKCLLCSGSRMDDSGLRRRIPKSSILLPEHNNVQICVIRDTHLLQTSQMVSRVSITFLQMMMSLAEMGVNPCHHMGLLEDQGRNCPLGNLLSPGIHHYHPVHLITLLLPYLLAYLLWCALAPLARHHGIPLPQVPTMTIIGSIVKINKGNI
jgi:hypothetical protein